MPPETLNFPILVFPVFFAGCPFFPSKQFCSHTWLFLTAFSQIWVPNGSGICLFTFLVCSPTLLHQFCSHQGGRKRSHMVFLQPFVSALMITSQLFAQIVTWWTGFCCDFFFPLIFTGNRNVYGHMHRGVYYIKAMLLCTLKYNILSKRFRSTWSETKRKLPRSFVRMKIQHDYKQIKFCKASSSKPPSTQGNCFNDILYLSNVKVC